MALTHKQKVFCEEYITNGYNARKAYFVAFPDADKSNRQPSYPYCLLKKPEIKEYIEERRTEIFDAYAIDAMRIAEKLASVAFADKEDMFYNVSAQLKAIELLQKQMGLQNQKTETKSEEVIEISLKMEEE